MSDFGSELISFIGVTESQNLVNLTAKDSFKEEAKFPISFTVFRNIAPVALFSVKKIAVSSQYEYEVDASASYDKDAGFSGKITEYEYTLANYKFSSHPIADCHIKNTSCTDYIKIKVTFAQLKNPLWTKALIKAN